MAAIVIFSMVWWFGYDAAGSGAKRFSLSSPATAAILRRTINATGLIYLLYQILQFALAPTVALYLLYRGIRDRRYFRGLPERLGFLPFPSTVAGGIWFHAVSVGEIIAAAELIRRLRDERPETPIFISTSTLAGRALADRKFPANVFFAPLDYRWIVKRVLRRLRPSAVVVLETEIWPNLYRESARAGAAVLIVNARISDRAYPRYKRFRAFFKPALSFARAILAQSDQDVRRFESLGARPVQVAGNLKYDLDPPRAIAPEILQFIQSVRPQKIWIAASTMTDGVIDEDDAVIAAIPDRRDLLVILAPRKPERFDLVAQKLRAACIQFARRSQAFEDTVTRLPAVLLLDSIGELAALFQIADVVFMGGTLADRGGHNVLEPAFFGKPVIVGPHMENFAAIAKEFHDAGALQAIESAAQLESAVSSLLEEPGEIGARARGIALSKRGAAARITDEILKQADQAIPNPQRTIFARAALTPLSWIWRGGVRLNKPEPRSLQTPVISVGGLTMGGAGKSPMVAHLAHRLREAGKIPAILTRGYKRDAKAPVIVPRGETATRDAIGDEASIFVARGDAHVGVGADRFAAGRLMEETLAPDLFLLDDGFQHRRLARKLDIVLIDATDPLAGGVFPLGRLREPLDALERASVIILTRCESVPNTIAVERLLKRYNAPIFRSKVVALEWVCSDGRTRAVCEPFEKPRAFCALGDPRTFWRTLDRVGIKTESRREFRDHHRYSREDLKKLANGTRVLLTTEKDAMNLPAGAAAMAGDCELWWLKIGIEIENEAELLRKILA